MINEGGNLGYLFQYSTRSNEIQFPIWKVGNQLALPPSELFYGIGFFPRRRTLLVEAFQGL